MTDKEELNGCLWLDLWYHRAGKQDLLNRYYILSLSAGIAMLLVYRAFSLLLGYPSWDENTVTVVSAMSLSLILLCLGIPYFMERARKAFRFRGGQHLHAPENVMETKLESRFRQKKDRYIIIALVILPFLFLNILQILQRGTIFFSDKRTGAALLLDIVNYTSGYLILYLFALVLWIVYVSSETLREIRMTPLRNAIPIEINAVDNVGGLGVLQEFIRDFLTYYFVIVALLILSYLPPGAFWSYEMLFVTIIFLIGIFIFFLGLGTIRDLVRGKIKETDDALNHCIEVQQDRLLKLSSDRADDSAADEISRIKTLLEIYHDEHSHLADLYNQNHGYDLRTVGQALASLMLPVFAFLVEAMSVVKTLKELVP